MVEIHRGAKGIKSKGEHVLGNSLYVHTKLKGRDFQSLIEHFKKGDNNSKKIGITGKVHKKKGKKDEVPIINQYIIILYQLCMFYMLVL